MSSLSKEIKSIPASFIRKILNDMAKWENGEKRTMYRHKDTYALFVEAVKIIMDQRMDWDRGFAIQISADWNRIQKCELEKSIFEWWKKKNLKKTNDGNNDNSPKG